MLMNTLAVRILMRRRSLRISQKSLAKQSGICVATISLIEGGQAKDIKLSTLISLAVVLRETPNGLLGIEFPEGQILN